MTSTISHAPSVNLLTSSMIVVSAVRKAPKPLMTARVIQPRDRSVLQCLTMPNWDSVNPTNTPMANSGTSACVSPFDATQQRGGEDGQHDDAVAVHLPVRAQPEHVRQEIVLGQQGRQHRKAAERGIGGQREQHRGDEPDRVVGEIATERRLGELGEHGDVGVRHHVELADQDPQPDQHGAEQDAEPHLRVLRAARPRLAELRHGVRDRLHPGQCRAAGGKRLQQQQDADRLGGRADLMVERHRGVGTDQAADDHRRHRQDEQQRRDREDLRRLRDAPQVQAGDEGEHGQAQPDPGAIEHGERGVEGLDAGRHADGRVQHVVDDQRRGGDQAGLGAQVRLGHGVRAAAVGKRRDHLAVGHHEHGEQDDDRAGDRQRVVQGGGAGRDQDDEDGLGAVGDRGERVEGERGQPLDRGQPMLLLMVRDAAGQSSWPQDVTGS